MVAEPEICRVNGRCSRGPTTLRGKAIAAKNSTRHGLLSQKPPLLITEDLTTFQSLMQALIDEYQPQTPTEHLLVQKLAMAWLRMYRVWNAEAASANLGILRQHQTKQYQTRCHDDEENLVELTHGRKTNLHPDVLVEERKLIEFLTKETELFIASLPKRNPRQWQNTAQLIELFKDALEKVVNDYPLKQVPLTPKFSTQDAFLKKLKQIRETEQELDSLWWKTLQMKDHCLGSRDVGFYREKSQQLVLACSERLLEIDETLANVQKLEHSITEAVTQTLAIPEKAEQLTRYEKHINRQLHDALNTLNSIQQQRQNQTSIGSFDQSANTQI